LWEQVFSRFELKILFEKREPQMIQIRPFKEKEKEVGEGRSQLNSQWKIPMLGDQWKEKEKHLFTSPTCPQEI
jgi:hypothetical protein